LSIFITSATVDGRLLFGECLLGNEEDEPVFGQGLFEGFDRFFPADEERKNHIREDHNIPYRKKRKPLRR
jgi:hypothetical protein